MKKSILLSLMISAVAFSLYADRGGRGGGGHGGGLGGGDRHFDGGGRNFDGGNRLDDQGQRGDRDRDWNRDRDRDFDYHDGGIGAWGGFGLGLGLGIAAGNFYPYHSYYNDYASGWTYTTQPYGNYTVYTWSNPNLGSSSYYQDVNGDVYMWDPILQKWIKVDNPQGIIPQ
jgi:hypothetical protein